ncbi:MAG: EAL domain-containing protein, partial [Spirochaetales bacterium]|nr:EAL domain-containing protein [Spirochaetales bacterium]
LDVYVSGQVDLVRSDILSGVSIESLLLGNSAASLTAHYRTSSTIVVTATEPPIAYRRCPGFLGQADDPERYAGFEPIRLALDGDSGRWAGKNSNGDDVIAVYGAAHGLHAAVYASINREEVLAPVVRQTAYSALAAALASFALFAAAVAAGKRFRSRTTDAEKMVLAASVIDHIVEGIVTTASDGTIRTVNRAFTEITGWKSDEAIGNNPRILKSDRHDDAFYDAMWLALRRDGSWTGEIWNRKRDGTVYPEWLSITAVRNVRGEAVAYVGVFLDLTEIKNRDAAISHLSARDPLTGLPNRALMTDRLVTSIHQAERGAESVGVLYLDVAKFKYINTSYGYAFGDTVLQSIATRLESTLRKGDTVARLAADDFVAILPRLHREEDAMTIADTIIDTIRKPFFIEDHELYLDASVGISYFPANGDDPDALVGAANAALNQAKEAGSGSIRVFTPALNDRILKRLSLESRLRHAVEHESFTVYYQPRVDARTRRVESVEALVRWIGEDGSIIPPGVFIPLAEENGMIVPIGQWVLSRALSDLVSWQTLDPTLRVSVNLSARQFRLPDLVSRVDTALSAAGIEATSLELEITESLAMGDVAKSVTLMTQLNERGISLSLDDFGTGYSSLYYLKRLPIQWLKIDQSFVRDYRAPDDSPANAIVHTIIEMAKSLGLGTIAEGCETEEQLGFLTRRGCDQIQGYYFSRPIPAADCASFIGKQL